MQSGLHVKLDISKATIVEHGYLLIPTPHELLLNFKSVYDRFSCVIYHAAMIGDKPVKGKISIENKDITHIRAALSEFIAIEDLIKNTYPDIDKNSYMIYKSGNPILHMLKIIRNYNIHISNSLIKKKTMMAKTLLENTPEIEINVPYISNLSLNELRRLNSAKDYSDAQLKEMISVFEIQQHEFGIDTLLIKAAIDYSELLSTALSSTQR